MQRDLRSKARSIIPMHSSPRSATKLALGAIAIGLAALVACAKGNEANGPSCDSTELLCSGHCADLQTDTENCGKCGVLCPAAQACVKGACSTQCPAGNSMCSGDGGGGKCLNLKTDNKNCGKCGFACPSGQICFAGACSGTCGDSKSGQVVCGGDGGPTYCANLQNDNQNCGACGTSCPSEQVCVNGSCRGSCTQDQTKCGGEGGPAYCANLKSDNANCGACGNTCGTLVSCIDGACVAQCTSSQLTCKPDGGTPYCTDSLSDNANCGSCGNACPSNKPVCSGGVCSDGTCNRTALVLGDTNSSSNAAYVSILQTAGFTVSSSTTTAYAGNPAASTFGVVIVSPGTSYTSDMPAAGQTSIVAAQAGTTGVIFTEWAAYMNTTSFFLTLKPLVLFPRSSGTTAALTFTSVVSHPIWNGLPSSFTTTSALGANVGSTLNAGAVLIASCSQCSNAGVAVKDTGQGRIVQVAHAAGYSGTWWTDPNLSKMLSNAALWAARCN